MECPPLGSVPALHAVAHVALGWLAWDHVWLAWAFGAWQLAQLAAGQRWFVDTGATCQGNSVQHTLWKVAQFAAGWLLHGHAAA